MRKHCLPKWVSEHQTTLDLRRMREMYMDVAPRHEVENSTVDRNYCLELNIKVTLKGDY